MTQQEVFDLLNGSLIDKQIGYDDLWEFCRSHDLEMFSGETRYCIASKDWDFVLKISRFDNVRDDYNAIEFANYENACKLGIEKIFLKMWKFGTLDCGLDIYAQVRYSFAHSGIDNNKERKMRKQVRKICSCKIYRKSHEHAYDGYRISNEWYARAYQIYGKQFMRKFERFTRDKRIGDLHDSNVGYLGKMPIILDFAGYHG